MTALLQVDNLCKSLHRSGASVLAADNISFHVNSGETLALVGPSGSGKTTLARLLMRLIEPDSGKIQLEGQDWLRLSGAKLRKARRAIQIVFQNPDAALNPLKTIGESLSAPLLVHRIASHATTRQQCVKLLNRVDMEASYLDRLPHELSGGQKQRVAIARAISVKPRLLVLDEATSALDSTVRAGVLDLLAELQGELGLAYLLISHDLMLVRSIANRIVVLDGGRVVETGSADQVIGSPQSKTAKALVAAALPLPFDIDG